jgi:hypothetical protein
MYVHWYIGAVNEIADLWRRTYLFSNRVCKPALAFSTRTRVYAANVCVPTYEQILLAWLGENLSRNDFATNCRRTIVFCEEFLRLKCLFSNCRVFVRPKCCFHKRKKSRHFLALISLPWTFNWSMRWRRKQCPEFLYLKKIFSRWSQSFKRFLHTLGPLATFIELPDFSLFHIPKRRNIYQMTTKYTTWPQNIPNDHKIHIPNDHKILKN